MTTTTTTKRYQITSAIDKLDGRVYVDDAGDIAGLVYYAAETRRYYAVDLSQIEGLAARLAAEEPDAYSLWCASEGYAGDGFSTEEEAALDADLVEGRRCYVEGGTVVEVAS